MIDTRVLEPTVKWRKIMKRGSEEGAIGDMLLHLECDPILPTF